MAEATKKSGLVWVRVPGHRSAPVWHVWHDDAAYVLVGLPGSVEQPLPGAVEAPVVEVVVRSKDKGVRLVAWEAAVRRVEPGDEEWRGVVPLLLGKRLNLPDGEEAAVRWERECALLRLTPTGRLVEGPGEYDESGHVLVPVPTPARTRVPRPFHVMRLRRRAESP